MKLIATKTATKGKKSVKLDVYTAHNMLTYADRGTNHFKTLEVRNFHEAMCRFWEWTAHMHGIETSLTLHNVDSLCVVD